MSQDRVNKCGAEDTMSKRPEKNCDLVMKGGVTSGVVYPKAIFELSKEYRFSSIGGGCGVWASLRRAGCLYGSRQIAGLARGSFAGWKAFEFVPFVSAAESPE